MTKDEMACVYAGMIWNGEQLNNLILKTWDKKTLEDIKEQAWKILIKLQKREKEA